MDLSALGLAAALAVAPPPVPRGAPAQTAELPPAPFVLARDGVRPLAWPLFIEALSRSGVVAVGEKHDVARHHQVQAEVIAALAARGLPVTVGLEMAAPADQSVLDAFLSGAMSEGDFSAWWKTAWGYDYSLYKPVFDAAKAARAPVVGLNVPRTLIKEVSRKGLAGLSPADRARLPASIQESADARYRAYVEASLDEHGPLPPARRANMRAVQAVWNEAMGENAARLAAAGRLVVVVAGQGHMLYGGGIPESAARRGAGAVPVVLPYPLDGETVPIGEQLSRLRDPASAELPLADYFRLTP